MGSNGYMNRKPAENNNQWHQTCHELTGVQQVGVLVSQSFVGQEVVTISIERKKGHHVVAVIVAYGGIGTWVDGPRRLMSSEPALKDTRREIMLDFFKNDS